MRLRTRTWFIISILCLLGAAYFWRLGDLRRQSMNLATEGREPNPGEQPPAAVASSQNVSMALLSGSTNASAVSRGATPPPPRNQQAPYRLKNTLEPIDQLTRNDRAILLNNAFIDTGIGTQVAIPQHLRTSGDPESYLIQSRGPITKNFKNRVEQSGGSIVSYIPNNAYLVRIDAAAANTLANDPAVQSVLAWEPYFKLDNPLLPVAVEQGNLEEDQRLNLVLFPDAEAATRTSLDDLGAQVLLEDRTPFGPSMVIEAPPDSLVALAQLPGVQGIEKYYPRGIMNDLARERVGVAPDASAAVEENHLELTGEGIPVNINDTGVDQNHPDLTGRVFPGDPIDLSTLTDSEGHGTHVAGTIASSGENSPTNDIPGSPSPPDFRGMAPDAELYVLPIDLLTGPLISDTYLQERAAERNYVDRERTDPIVSNNSWGYIGAFDYNSAAASYDQAVRDALPEMEGSQPIIYVFSAGNSGFGSEDGLEGEAGTIGSPGVGKNVITVGAIEAFRNITNEVITITNVSGTNTTVTNMPFLGDTDSDNEVASFSSRGNVGIGAEGSFGRFKPDVVAPGTYVVSTRSSEWEDPTGFSSSTINLLENQQVAPGQLVRYGLFFPSDAVFASVQLLTNAMTVNPQALSLPLYARYNDFPTEADFVSFNRLEVPGDFPLQAPGDFRYSLGNLTDQATSVDIRTTIIETNAFGEFFDELKNLDDDLAPYYRYESGTSMSAPVVTGTIALMQQYLEENGFQYSPALIKALLINGARSVNILYSFTTRQQINYQGWGLINLTNTLPATPFSDSAAGAVKFVNESPDLAVATGQTRTWRVQLSPEAQGEEFKVSLVWTDPPGNPNASVKLVNDLDLIVTRVNEDTDATDDVFFGNNFPLDSDFTPPIGGGTSVTNDVVNNVENVYLRDPQGTNFLVSVRGRRVNVNAVTAHPQDIAQDFALVISTGNPAVTNAVRVTEEGTPDENAQLDYGPTIVTNGVPILKQRVGANSPLHGGEIGLANQWRFYVFTNDFDVINSVAITNGPNVAIATFLPPNLSSPTRNDSGDIDLYVTRDDPSLLTLNPATVNGALKSRNEGGTELVTVTDSFDDEVFYVGVKSEDQQAVEFALVVLSTEEPFEENVNGQLRIRGQPANIAIEDGSPQQAPPAFIFGVGISPEIVGRATVENFISHENFGDLVGKLSHNSRSVILNNHTVLDPINGGITNNIIYDDSQSGEQIDFNIRPSDGPGSLNNFLGELSSGLWVMAMIDNSPNHVGSYGPLNILVDPVQDLTDVVTATVQPNRFRYFVFDAPLDITELRVVLSNMDPALPLDLYIRRGDLPTLTEFDKRVSIDPPGGELVLTERDDPPLNPGRYFIGVFNPNPVAVTFQIQVFTEFDINPEGLDQFFADEETPLTDDAKTISTIEVPTDLRISDIRVGVRIDHPRVSDLALRLISPQVTTILLAENRGLETAADYGASVGGTNHSYATFTINTNLDPELIKFADPPFHVPAADLQVQNPVLLQDGFEGVALKDPDSSVNIYTNGETVSSWSVGFRDDSAISIITGDTAFEGTNYAVMGAENFLGGRTFGSVLQTFPTRVGAEYNISFKHRGSATQVLTNGVGARFVATAGSGWEPASVKVRAKTRETTFELRSLRTKFTEVDDVQIEQVAILPDAYYFPEETLEPLVGERALGNWRLEVWDRRTGPAGGAEPPAILNWKLEIDFANPTVGAVSLEPGQIYFGTVTNNQPAYFKVHVPRNATAATNIAFSAGDIVLAGDRRGLPVFNPNQDEYYSDFFGPGFGESFVITTNDPPTAPLQPGQNYYLGVKNFNNDEVNDFVIAVFFDRTDPVVGNVEELENGVTVTNTIPPGPTFQYYKFESDPEAIESVVTLEPLDGNVDLYVRKEQPNDPAPLPNTANFDYASTNALTAIDEVTINIDGSISFPPLEPGTWYVGVLNRDEVDVNYQLTWTETLADVTRLQNNLDTPGSNPDDQTYDYYSIDVPPDAVQAVFEVLNPTGEVFLDIKKGQLPFFPNVDYSDDQPPGVEDRRVTVRNTTQPVPLSPGRWYLGVFNNSGGPVNYTVRVTITTAPIEQLFNMIPVTHIISWTNRVDTPMDFYRYSVSPLAERVVFELFDMNGNYNLDLLAKFGLADGLPTDNNFDYSSTNSIGQRETISVVPNSLPVPLQSGNWYLTVIHRGPQNVPDSGVQYTIQATEFVPVVTPLTNNVPVTATNPSLNQADYYKFEVSDNAIEVQFQTSDQDGDVDIYVRKDAPLPNDKNFDYASENPGTAGELIRINPGSNPVPLEPGEWFLSVINRENRPVTYTVVARELSASVATRLTSGLPETDVLNDLPGQVDYYVFNVSSNAVRAEFETFNADGPIQLFLKKDLPLPDSATRDYESLTPGSGDNLIIVRTNSVPVPLSEGDWYMAVVKEVPADPVTYSIVATEFFAEPPFDPDAPQFPEVIPDPDNNQVCLRWRAEIGRFYRIEHKDSPADTEWSEVAVVQADEISETYCTTLGATIGLYRVVPLDDFQPPPGEGEPVIPLVIPDEPNNQICLQWPAEIGRFYRIETKANLDDPDWMVIDTIQAQRNPEEYCFDADTGVGFYRVVPLGENPTPPDINNPILPKVMPDFANDQVCLTWNAEIGRFYRIERKETLVDSDWTVLATVEATSNPHQYCVPLMGAVGFYRVVPLEEVAPVGEGEPIVPQVVPDPDSNQICLEWQAEIGRFYRIETKAALDDPEWIELATIEALRETERYCVDTAVGFYQIVPLGEDTASVNPPIVPQVVPDFDAELVCLNWDAVIGNWYRIERKASIVDPVWSELDTVQADASPDQYCLDLNNSLGFYRIIPLGPDYVPEGPSEVILIQSEIRDDKLVLTWNSVPGRTYTLQGNREIANPEWTNLQTIEATGTVIEVELQLPTPYSIFRVIAFGVMAPQPVGALDTAFQSTAIEGRQLWAATTQADGKILIGGDFITVNGVTRNRIARLNEDGSVDTSFDAGALTTSGPGLIVNEIVPLPDGRILAGGRFASIGGVSNKSLARLNEDGSVDESFASRGVRDSQGAEGEIFAIAVQVDRKILIGGNFTLANQQGRANIARLNPDGTLDTSFAPSLGVNAPVREIVVQPDGKILIGGDFSQVNTTLLYGVARLNSDGTLDTSFNPGAGARFNNGATTYLVSSLALQDDGKIIVAGHFDQFAGLSRPSIARLNSDGTLDLSFDPGQGPASGSFPNIVFTVAVQSDGKAIIGGAFDRYDGTPRNKIARLKTNGGLDADFVPELEGAPGFNARVHTLHLQSDSKLLAAGVNVTTQAGLVRFDTGN